MVNNWKETDSIWVITNINTGMFYLCRSGKVGWASSGAAKNAYKLCTGTHFDLQDDYALKEVEFDGKT